MLDFYFAEIFFAELCVKGSGGGKYFIGVPRAIPLIGSVRSMLLSYPSRACLIKIKWDEWKS
jgi:hypothetical protein